MNGKPLNGAMFWNLMQNYVEAINKGAIPSIESSWAYICKNECLKAVDNSYDTFRKLMSEGLQEGGPFYEEELKDIYTNSKRTALEHFNKVAVGDEKTTFHDNLKQKMKTNYD